MENLKVKATQTGHYNNVLVEEGQEFALNHAKDFSHNWMEMADGSEAPKGARKPYNKAGEEEVVSNEKMVRATPKREIEDVNPEVRAALEEKKQEVVDGVVKKQAGKKPAKK